MASVLTICSLCVFQYVSVVLPMNKSLTNFRCLVMVLCAWIISIFLATGPTIRNGGATNSLQTFSTANIITLQTEQIFPTILPWCFAVIYFLVFSWFFLTSVFYERCMNTNRAWQWRHPSRQHRSQVLPFLWKRNCVWQCQLWFWHFWFVVLRFSSSWSSQPKI